MSCEQNHVLPTLARLAGVAETELDQAWATATITARQARAIRPARSGQPPADEPPLAGPDPLLVQRVWGGSGHREPTDATRRALIAALRVLEHRRKGNPARLAALRHLLGEPGAPLSSAWRAIVLGMLPLDVDSAWLNPWDAAELLAAGITHPDLVTRAAAESDAAGRVLIDRPDLVGHRTLVAAMQKDHNAVTWVRIACPELRRHPVLIDRLDGDTDAWWAWTALVVCPGWDPPRLWERVAREHPAAWDAARSIVADPTAATAEQWAAVAAHPPAAALVLARVPAARHSPEVVAAVLLRPALVVWMVIADPTLLEIPAIHADVAGDPGTVAWVLVGCPELRDHPDLLATVTTDAWWTAQVVIRCPELRGRPDLIARIATDADARWAAEVVVRCPDLRFHPDLLAAVARDGDAAMRVLRECSDVRDHPDLLAAVTGMSHVVEWLIQQAGWHPTLWPKMREADRQRWARQHGWDAATLDAIAARWPAITEADRATLARLPMGIPLPKEGGTT